jgi:hypothetical protein
VNLAYQLVIFAIIIVAFAFNFAVPLANRLAERRNRIPFRRIAALEALPKIVGESIEASRPLHVSIGSATIGDESTALALAGSEFIYYLTRQVAIGDASPIFTVSEGAAIPLAFDTLRRAYSHENRNKQFSGFSTRWYPAGKRSLAFAAALMAMQADDKLSGNVLVGRFGLELALILDAANLKKRRTIATSDQLEGQAIAYALAEETLIGEEVFAAAAYLTDEKKIRYRNSVLDMMRIVTVAAILILLLLPYIAPDLSRLILGGS